MAKGQKRGNSEIKKPPLKTVAPPGAVSRQVNTAVGSESLMLTEGAVDLVGVAAVTVGAGGATVSRVQVTVVELLLPAASVAVTTRV